MRFLQFINEDIFSVIEKNEFEKYPKIDFNKVPASHRSGDVIRGEDVLGHVNSPKLGRGQGLTFLCPDKYDYTEYGKTLKSDEILVRVENQLTKRRGKSFENATIAKVNLKTKTMSFPTEDVLQGITDDFKWEKAFRVKQIIIFLPFHKII